MYARLSISPKENIGVTTMKPLYLLFYILVIFGHTISIIEAGLLDPIRNILDPITNQPVEPDQMLPQFTPQFQGNNQAADNTDFNPTKTRMPNDYPPFEDSTSSRLNYEDPTSSRLNYEDPTSSRLNYEDPTSSRLNYEDPTSSRLNYEDPISSRLSFDDPTSSKSSYNNPRITPGDPSSSRITFEDANSSKLPLYNPTNTMLLVSDSSSSRLPPEDSTDSVIHYDDAATSNSPSNNPSSQRLPNMDPNLPNVDPKRLPSVHSSSSKTTFVDLKHVNQPFNTQRKSNTPSLLGYNQRWLGGSNQNEMQQILANLSQKTTKSTTPDYDKVLAEKFPQAVKLLEQLKKLNKLKQQQEQQKKQDQAKDQTESVTTEKTPITTAVSYDKDAIAELLKPLEGVDDKPVKAANQMKVIMKKLTKTRFYYRAQPVTPENEKNHHTNETVYYIDL